jgi:uncharacterized membrane protein YkoI
MDFRSRERYVALVFVLFGCGSPPPSRAPEQQATAPSAEAAKVASTAAHEPSAAHEAEDDHALLAALPASKLDLLNGIVLAERQGAVAISAKFELEDGKLSLSVYSAKKGLELDAEHNVLSELKLDPTVSDSKPTEEVFSDAKHLARASYHLTLVQRAQLSLSSVISKALAKQPGRVYSVEPAARAHLPIFHVRIATSAGSRVEVDVEGGA